MRRLLVLSVAAGALGLLAATGLAAGPSPGVLSGGGTALRFRTYETLDAGANTSLLSLTAQHPSATVDRNQSDYVAAEKRLFPNG